MEFTFTIEMARNMYLGFIFVIMAWFVVAILTGPKVQVRKRPKTPLEYTVSTKPTAPLERKP